MSTTYNHIRMSTIDSNNNIAILYPESTSSDILVSRVNNTNIPVSVSNIQLLANSLANSAFNNIINDNTISVNYTWSSYKINNKVSTINFYVSNNDSKLHFTNSDNEDNVIDYTSGSGTATADKVLQGYTFSNSNGVNIPGAMLNQGTKTYTIEPGNSQTIPEGYHNGNGSVSVSGGKSSTYTMTNTQINSTIDMGINNTYRYINATNVYNKGVSDGNVHTGTYTLTGTGTFDMGVKHTYRYIKTGPLILKPDVIQSNIRAGSYVTANVTGSTNKNNAQFCVTYIDASNRYIYLISVDSYAVNPYSGDTWTDAMSYRWNVSFAANTLTDNAKTINGCQIPSMYIFENYITSTYWGRRSVWTATAYGSADAYYLNQGSYFITTSKTDRLFVIFYVYVNIVT